MLITALLLSALAHAAPGDLPDCAADAEAQVAAKATLQSLLTAANADHANPTASTLKADAKRAKAVAKLLKKQSICDGEAAVVASQVLLNATDEASLASAYELAMAAAFARVEPGPWLVPQTYDRLQLARGLPQAYGGQQLEVFGKRCLQPVDPAFTDEARAEWGVAPLTEQLAAFIATSDRPNVAPNLEAMRREGLICDPLKR